MGSFMKDKIKLEEELEFLKESFDAEVITKEEYEKAKARVEEQLREVEAKEKIGGVKEDIKKEESVFEEPKEEEKQEPVEEKVQEAQSVPEHAREQINSEESFSSRNETYFSESPVSDKPKEEAKSEEKKEEPEIEIKEIKEPSGFKESNEEKIKEEVKEKRTDEKENDTNDIINSKNEFKFEGEKKKAGLWIAAAVVFLIVICYLSFLFFANEKNAEEVLPLCFSDADCAEEGMVGFCNNPGVENAECVFKEAVKVNFIVLNAKDCFNCDTSRVERIIKGWFPGAIKEEVELNSEAGRLLVRELGIELLPAYIFNSSLEKTFRYEELKLIFSEVDNKHILSSGASGSTFYANKEEVPKRLYVFLMKDDKSTEKAEENIKEFLDLFNDKIDYKKYLVDKENDLVKSWDINTFPTFLVNNKIRFSGVQPAETIKENFCKLNKLDECNYKLSENLV